MNYRLRTKLSLSYGIIALVIVGMIIIMFISLVDNHFIAYVQENNEQKIDSLVHDLEHQYHAPGGWDQTKISDISERALNDGLVLDIKDIDGNIVWDASAVFKKSDKELLSPIEKNMKSRYSWWNGKIAELPEPIHYGSSVVGTVVIKYYEPFYLTGHDLDFINMLYRILTIILAASIVLAVILGVWISRQISIPMIEAIKLTKEISKGDFRRRIETRTNTLEVKELSSAVNILAERMEEQEMIRKRIVSDVSHELRTPLTGIQNYVEALIDGVWEPTPERLSNIYNEILRVNRLVSNLSGLARYENGIEKLNKSVFSLENIINRIVTNFETEVHNKDLSVDILNNVKDMYGDQDKISQVIINILSNAINYSNDGGKISIETYKDNLDIIIRIKDTGIGIPKEDLPYIFERFYRVDKSRNKATGGSGIGLTIVKSIVEAHNGSIDITSSAGAGTEVTVKLPQK